MTVSGLASGGLENYPLVLDPRVTLMLWGHGKSYVTPANWLGDALEGWLARRANHVFAYTDGGAAHLRGVGVPQQRTTVVYNSTDTQSLRKIEQTLTEQDVRAFRSQHCLGEGPVGLFVGALDNSKRLPLLLEATDIVRQEFPAFRLLLAGAGPLNDYVVAAAKRRDYVRVLYRVEPEGLPLLARTATLLLMPGRVGLVAVDALALGLPVVTTTYRYHAPELEYLGSDCSVRTPENARAYAVAVLRLLSAPDEISRLSAAARCRGDALTIERMAAAFADVLIDYCNAES